MTIERSGRYDEHANVRFMRWAENPGDERRDGLRIGYGRAFCFIPESEAMNLAHSLLDYIEANNLNTHA
ncbi:hypothetical protein [Brachybacterium sp.]|uniref:hypothetical protein n=1 Tax=Brachybacterium sp. TaxID=1891286 RepID=UPI003F933046